MKPGDRVKLSKDGLQQGMGGPRNRNTGVVLSISRLNGFLRVLRDGTKTPYRYHPIFWEPL